MHDETEELRALVVLRPFRRLLRYGIATRLALTLPLSAVALWLTIPSGRWWIVIVAEGFALLLSGALTLAFLRTGIELHDGGVRERGFFGRSALVCSGSAASILLIQLYQPNAADTKPNLFVVAPSGRLLLRMRGQYWSEQDMLTVAGALGVAVTNPPGPLSVRELARTSPGLLYWFERYSLSS